MLEQYPGKELAVKNAKDLSPEVFRRLVATRYRRRIDSQLPPVESETERRELESRIENLEKIDQTPDFLPARYLADGNRRSLSVCRISTPSGKGTGFLIAPGILMTNNHVLESAEDAASSVAEFNFELGQSAILVSLMPNDLFLTDIDLDFTVVACDSQGLDNIPHIQLSRDPHTITRNERAAIIQHPAGRPKEVALHNSEVIRVKDKVIHYRTDTEPGSSGSPVFNDKWDLVALHHAGWFEADGRATNEGIRIPSIIAKLEQLGFDAGSREQVESILSRVEGVSPLLGFFDTAGLPLSDTEVVVDTFTGTQDFADIGFWNIEHFNNSVSSSRVKNVADVFERLIMDVMGLVEVESGALDRLVVELGERGLSYDYKVLDVSGTQDLAVLFDQETTMVRSRPDLLEPFDTASKLKAKTETGKSAFPRKPMLAEVEIQSDIGTDPLRFLMLVIHLKAFGDAESRARRKLASKVLEEIIVELQESEGLPIILGGDFNDLITADSLGPIKDSPDLFSLTLDDATGGDNAAITFVGQSHRSLIDHVVVSGDVQFGPIQGDDAAIVRLDRVVRDFVDNVSDHIPVVFRLVLRNAPLEFGAGGKATTAPKKPLSKLNPRVPGRRRRDYGK